MKEINREISILKQRILEYLDAKGVTRNECYKNTGISNSVLSQPNGMSEDNILKFLSCYRDISLDWLFYGIGEKFKSPPKTSEQINNTLSPKESFYCEMYKDKEIEYKEILLKMGGLQEANKRLEEENKNLKNKIGTEKCSNKNNPPSFQQETTIAKSETVFVESEK